jgi:hypothetical protein
MTSRHRGRPRLSTLVATLLRFPSVLQPKTVIVSPRKENPDSSLNNGQFLMKYLLKRPISDTIRPRLITLAMKWEVASKKKTAIN